MLNYYRYQEQRQSTDYQVQEHKTAAEREAFWHQWRTADDESALAEYIRAHLMARRFAY